MDGVPTTGCGCWWRECLTTSWVRVPGDTSWRVYRVRGVVVVVGECQIVPWVKEEG